MRDIDILYYIFIVGECSSAYKDNKYDIKYEINYDNTSTKGLIKYNTLSGKIVYGKDTARWFVETLLKYKRKR